MPILDTPITSNDQNLKKVLQQNKPVLLILHEGEIDKPLQDALGKEARKNAGDMLIVRIDVKDSPDTHVRYGEPPLPALVSFTADGKVKADADQVRPRDVRDHVKHLLQDKPLPQRAANGSSGNGRPVVVTDSNFRNEVLKSKVPVLVDFWAAWCGPCHQIAPHIEQIAKDFNGKVKVAKLDVDKNQIISGRYNIRSIPTMIMFEGGQPAARVTGADPVSLRQMVKRFAV